MSKFMILFVILLTVSYRSISQSVILSKEQAVNVIADLEEYDWLKNIAVPGYLERINLLESIVDQDKKILDNYKQASVSLKEALRLRELELATHKDLEQALRKENKKLRKKLLLTKAGGGILVSGLAVVLILTQIN